MKLVVGLGNPGEKYQNTRHNVGFMVADQLTEGHSWSQSKAGLYQASWLHFNLDASHKQERVEVQVIKPLTYMNLSGQAVASVLGAKEKLKIEQIYVIHDDLDLELGRFKLQFGTGPKQHRGLISIYQTLKTDQFWHMRVGIDSRQGKRQLPAEKYVLSTFSQKEQQILAEIMPNICTQLETKLIES